MKDGGGDEGAKHLLRGFRGPYLLHNLILCIGMLPRPKRSQSYVLTDGGGIDIPTSSAGTMVMGSTMTMG